MHGLFLEIFAVDVQLLLFISLPCSLDKKHVPIRQVTACWERAAGDREGIMLETAIILDNSIYCGFSCTLQTFRAPGIKRQGSYNFFVFLW